MDNDMLSSLLNDPDALQSAMKTVSDMLGSPQQPAGAPASKDYDPSAELMERALPVISTILQSGQGAVKPEKRVLLNAVKPFVTDEVAGQFDHAMRLVSIARIARTVLGQLGQSGGTSSDDGTQSL